MPMMEVTVKEAQQLVALREKAKYRQGYIAGIMAAQAAMRNTAEQACGGAGKIDATTQLHLNTLSRLAEAFEEKHDL